jgi:hypothetical protein
MRTRTYVRQIEIKIDDTTARTLYEVQYIKKFGDGYSSGNLWGSYGIYESEVIANFVAQKIENGEINP